MGLGRGRGRAWEGEGEGTDCFQVHSIGDEVVLWSSHVCVMDSRVSEVLDAWERQLSPAETSDPLWRLLAYRVARCLLDHVGADARRLQPSADRQLVDQLVRAIASIGANVAEGYSRRGLADRARFFGYALGSTREALVWYRGVAHALPEADVELRLLFLQQLRRLLIGLARSAQDRGGLEFRPRRTE